MLTLHTNVKMGAIGSKATSQLTNFDFNSYCRFGEKYLGCATDGIYSLGGYTFDGEEIEAYIQTFKNKLGYNGNKRVHFIYLSLEADDDLIVTPTVDGIARPSITVHLHRTGRQHIRVKCGEGTKGEYWSFKIENTNGCWFAIDIVEVLPCYLDAWQKA